jgi:RNA-directed DNA polymerase
MVDRGHAPAQQRERPCVERRGHRLVRYADARHICVNSPRAGQRVVASVTRCLARRRKLAVNAANSAVARLWQRTFPGFAGTGHRPNRRRVSEQALEACKHAVRELTARTRGGSRGRGVGDLRWDLDGGYADLGLTEAPASVTELDSQSRRRRRGSHRDLHPQNRRIRDPYVQEWGRGRP